MFKQSMFTHMILSRINLPHFINKILQITTVIPVLGNLNQGGLVNEECLKEIQQDIA